MNESRKPPHRGKSPTSIGRGVVAALVVTAVIGSYLALERDRTGRGPMKIETVPVRIDEATIAEGDAWRIIEPVSQLANIYDGPAEYDRSLHRFSRPQRLVVAVWWYRAEVNNGGHHQFYANSTGIVWIDALEGFRAMGAKELAANLEESAKRLGGSPSLDRVERNEQLDRFDPKFDDLDDKFYEHDADLDDLMIAYIRSRPGDFHFEGTVQRAVPRG